MSHPFDALTPDLVLDAVESLGYLSDARVLALNSYENRVYQVGIEDSAPLIAKFYRPERWTDAAIREEHAFTLELEEHEVPVVAPLRCEGETLFEHAGFRFALFPRRGGRAPEPGNLDQLYRLRYGLCQDSTLCNRPVPFSGIAVSVCLPRLHSKFNKVLYFGLRLLPLFPDIHPEPSSKPSVPLRHCALHTRDSEVSKPSGHIGLEILHNLPDVSALTAGSQFLELLLRFLQGFRVDSNSTQPSPFQSNPVSSNLI